MTKCNKHVAIGSNSCQCVRCVQHFFLQLLPAKFLLLQKLNIFYLNFCRRKKFKICFFNFCRRKKFLTFFSSVFGGKKLIAVGLRVVVEFVLNVGSLHDGEALGEFSSVFGGEKLGIGEFSSVWGSFLQFSS